MASQFDPIGYGYAFVPLAHDDYVSAGEEIVQEGEALVNDPRANCLRGDERNAYNRSIRTKAKEISLQFIRLRDQGISADDRRAEVDRYKTLLRREADSFLSSCSTLSDSRREVDDVMDDLSQRFKQIDLSFGVVGGLAGAGAAPVALKIAQNATERNVTIMQRAVRSAETSLGHALIEHAQVMGFEVRKAGVEAGTALRKFQNRKISLLNARASLESASKATEGELVEVIKTSRLKQQLQIEAQEARNVALQYAFNGGGEVGMEHARRSLHVQGNQIRIPSHLPADSVASEALVSKAEVNLLGTKMKAAKVSAKAVAAKSVRTGTAAAVGGLVGGAVGLVAAATLALLTDPDEVR